MEFFYPVVKFFTAGGAFMFPILLVGAVSAAIAIERYITLTKMGARNRSTWARVEPTLASAHFEKARELTSKDESPFPPVLLMRLALQGAAQRHSAVENALQ